MDRFGARVYRLVGRIRAANDPARRDVSIDAAHGEEVGHDAGRDFVTRVPDLVGNGGRAAGDAALIRQFRADIAFGKALNFMAAVAGLRLKQLLAFGDARHLRLIGDILHGRGSLGVGRVAQVRLSVLRGNVFAVQQFNDALGRQRLLVADGKRIRVVGRMALGAGGLHVLGLQQRRLRMLRVAMRAVLDEFSSRAVMAGRAAESRERVLFEIDLLILVVGLVFLRQTGLGRDAVGELRPVNDAQIMRIVFGFHADARMRPQGLDRRQRRLMLGIAEIGRDLLGRNRLTVQNFDHAFPPSCSGSAGRHGRTGSGPRAAARCRRL